MTWRAAVAEFKGEFLRATLAGCGHNISRAARALRVNRQYLQRLVKQYCPDVPRLKQRRPLKPGRAPLAVRRELKRDYLRERRRRLKARAGA
jgi:hypothetical protein